ncbi:MAG: hypothetical protein EXR28_00950 [Betaproteobacteria bacterium]|nr:hypothetical protein [Betaproteobacteria bacterium]
MIARMFFALTLCTATAVAYAQAYPVKPITAIVPFAAGGPGDALMRSFAVALTKSLKQTLVIENAGARWILPASNRFLQGSPISSAGANCASASTARIWR